MNNCNRGLRARATSKNCALSAVCRRSGKPPFTRNPAFFDYGFRCQKCITLWTIFTSHTMHKISSQDYNNVLINKFPIIAARVMVRLEFTTSTIDYPDHAHHTYNMPGIIMMIAQISFKSAYQAGTNLRITACSPEPPTKCTPHINYARVMKFMG